MKRGPTVDYVADAHGFPSPRPRPGTPPGPPAAPSFASPYAGPVAPVVNHVAPAPPHSASRLAAPAVLEEFFGHGAALGLAAPAAALHTEVLWGLGTGRSWASAPAPCCIRRCSSPFFGKDWDGKLFPLKKFFQYLCFPKEITDKSLILSELLSVMQILCKQGLFERHVMEIKGLILDICGFWDIQNILHNSW
ncbi:hypothetical protein TNIN_443071 [Trichonephila inaurata madagascariensis]|uniref:Uncharacterized protein n=1 Tax=Trichonephila inaurata madagascariensis TaxID=2747483 RepID=A0A8X6Y650_9ARAC|nr:hypothetical protein TNIN_443071 [Trichonephila inaurata madagascariensis]